MRILRVYEVHMTQADTPGVSWRDIGPLRYKGGVMRPSELVLEFRISRGAPRFRGGTIIGRRRLRREIRRRVRQFAWAGPDFWSRRVEDVGNEMLADGTG